MRTANRTKRKDRYTDVPVTFAFGQKEIHANLLISGNILFYSASFYSQRK